MIEDVVKQVASPNSKQRSSKAGAGFAFGVKQEAQDSFAFGVKQEAQDSQSQFDPLNDSQLDAPVGGTNSNANRAAAPQAMLSVQPLCA